MKNIVMASVLVFGLAVFSGGAESFGGIGIAMYKSGLGASVAGVASGSPADAAGLKAGDCITAVDGESVSGKKVSEIRELIRDVAGKPVVLTVSRDGETHELTINRVSMKIAGVSDSSDAKASSEKYELLDVINVKKKSTAFYIGKTPETKAVPGNENQSASDVRLRGFDRKSVDVDILSEGDFTVKIFSANGSLIKQRKVANYSKGARSIPWDNSKLPAGNYTVKITQGGKTSAYVRNLE